MKKVMRVTKERSKAPARFSPELPLEGPFKLHYYPSRAHASGSGKNPAGTY